jgi:hypothetical protein
MFKNKSENSDENSSQVDQYYIGYMGPDSSLQTSVTPIVAKTTSRTVYKADKVEDFE